MKNTVWNLLEELRPKIGISEVIINSPEHIFIEKDGELIRLDSELDKDDIENFCQDVARLNDVQFSKDNPIVDGVLADGSRVNLLSTQYTLGPSSAITIRKYLKSLNTLDNSKEKFGINQKWVEFFKYLVKSKSNILISGGTGVGKTTFLNLLLQEVPGTQRVITIEDTRELSIQSANSIGLVSAGNGHRLERPLDVRMLVKNALRMRPDRLILGEVRGAEAFDLLQVMNTGHDGSMCTIHASSAAESLVRLENLFLFSGYDIPVRAIRSQISNALDYIIHLERDRDQGRVVAKVIEVGQMEGERILLLDLGKKDGSELQFTGFAPQKMQKLLDIGMPKNFF